MLIGSLCNTQEIPPVGLAVASEQVSPLRYPFLWTLDSLVSLDSRVHSSSPGAPQALPQSPHMHGLKTLSMPNPL